MNTSSLSQLPGYRYNEYLLVLSPHEDLMEKIRQIKADFNGKYKIEGRATTPHITLANFIQFEMREERLVNHLKTIAMGYHAFKVELRDYGSFPSHTIFINIESKQQVQNLGKELRSARQIMTLNKDNKPHFINEPHLTIARKLLPWQYEQGWLEYSNRNFTGRFIADSMLLLKRRIGEKNIEKDAGRPFVKYQIVRRFDFMNLPVATTQGKLFV